MLTQPRVKRGLYQSLQVVGMLYCAVIKNVILVRITGLAKWQYSAKYGEMKVKVQNVIFWSLIFYTSMLYIYFFIPKRVYWIIETSIWMRDPYEYYITVILQVD